MDKIKENGAKLELMLKNIIFLEGKIKPFVVTEMTGLYYSENQLKMMEIFGLFFVSDVMLVTQT